MSSSLYRSAVRSSSTGEVKVHWELSSREGGYHLGLRWEETGGSQVIDGRPKRGFGTRLIERTVKQELDGEVLLEFAPTGVVCELRVPLP